MQAAQRAQPSLNAFQPSSSASISSKQPTPGNSGTQDRSGIHRPDISIPGAPSLAAQGSGVFAQQASTNLQQPPSSHHTPANVPPPLRQAHSLKPCATDCPKSAPVLVRMQIRHIIASNPSWSHVWLLAHRASLLFASLYIDLLQQRQRLLCSGRLHTHSHSKHHPSLIQTGLPCPVLTLVDYPISPRCRINRLQW